jgi:hypothetical protein
MAYTPKPIKGTALLERRERRATLRAHEQKEMQAAKARDRHVCRWPACEFRSRDLPIDACHAVKHRGPGGDVTGERTQRHLIIALCRIHHSLLDAHELRIEPLTAAVFDGPVAFYRKHPDTGRWQHLASETRTS